MSRSRPSCICSRVRFDAKLSKLTTSINLKDRTREGESTQKRCSTAPPMSRDTTCASFKPQCVINPSSIGACPGTDALTAGFQGRSDSPHPNRSNTCTKNPAPARTGAISRQMKDSHGDPRTRMSGSPSPSTPCAMRMPSKRTCAFRRCDIDRAPAPCAQFRHLRRLRPELAGRQRDLVNASPEIPPADRPAGSPVLRSVRRTRATLPCTSRDLLRALDPDRGLRSVAGRRGRPLRTPRSPESRASAVRADQRRRARRLSAVRAATEAFRHPLVHEGSQFHALVQELRHDSRAARPH